MASGDRGRPFRVTHTMVQRFLRCHRQYWFAHVEGAPWPEEDESPALILGNAVHRGMQELVECGDPEVARARVDAYLRMPKHAALQPGTGYYDAVWECLERGFEACASIASRHAWAELTTWAPWPSQNLAVLARADRVDELVDGTYQVIDWKTGRYEDPAATDDQLDLAHVALRVALRLTADVDVVAIAWNLRTGSRRERRLNRDHARASMKRAAGLARRFQEETDFAPTPGPHCLFCRWRVRCDAAALVLGGAPVDELMEGVDLDEDVDFIDGADSLES